MSVKRLGLDISGHNGNVNIQTLKNNGVEFVIIRAGYGGDYTNQDDSKYVQNVKACEAAGMPFGVYLYSYALNMNDLNGEVAHMKRLLKVCTQKPKYGVWFDMEDADGYKARNGMPSNAILVNMCLSFCEQIEAIGYHVGTYANLDWFKNRLNDSRMDKYDRWLAQWSSSPSYTRSYGIWQFTDSYNIGGAKFDANYAFTDYLNLGNENGNQEEETMTQEQFEKMYDIVNPKYNTVDQVPEAFRSVVSEYVKRGIIQGDGKTELGGLRLDVIKGIVVGDRAGGAYYNRVEDLQDWAKPDMKKLVDEGIIGGDGKTELGRMPYQILRAIIICKRMIEHYLRKVLNTEPDEKTQEELNHAE